MPREGDVHLGGLEKEQRERRAHPRRGAPALPPCGRPGYPLPVVKETGAPASRAARGPPMSFSLHPVAWIYSASYKKGREPMIAIAGAVRTDRATCDHPSRRADHLFRASSVGTQCRRKPPILRLNPQGTRVNRRVKLGPVERPGTR